MLKVIHILRQLRHYWIILVIVPLIAAGAVVYLTRNMPLEYESEATLYIHLPTNKGLSLTNEEFKQFQIATYFQNVLELARSRKNLEMVRIRILRDALAGKSNWVRKTDGFPFNDSLTVISRLDSLIKYGAIPDVTKPLDAGITIFMENNGLSASQLSGQFELYRQAGSDYVKLNTHHSDPFEAAYFSRLLVQHLLANHKELSRGRSQNDREMYEKLVAQAKDVLDEKMAKLESYKVKNQIINLPEHTKAIVNQMVDLEVQRAGLVEMLASKEEGMVQIKNELGLVSDLPVSLESNVRLVEMKQSLRALNNRGEKSSDEDVAIRAKEIEKLVNQFIVDVPVDLKRTKQEMIQQYITYKVDVEMTRELIPLVNAELKRIQNYAKFFAPLESNIATLDREITTAQESYLILINKLNLARTVEQGSGEQGLAILDSPNIPLRPKKGKRKVMVIGVWFVSLFLIVAMIVIIELLDKGLWHTQQVQSRFPAKVIAGLPSLQEMISSTDPILANSLAEVRNQQLKAVSHHITQTDGRIKTIALASAFENEGRHEIAWAIKHNLQKQGIAATIYDVERGQNPTDSNSDSVSILILPPTSVFTNWIAWMRYADMFLYTIRAGRTATFIDDQFFAEVSEKTIYTILNHIPSDKLDDLGMTIQKRRSKLRVWMKQLLQFQFKGTQSLDFV